MKNQLMMTLHKIAADGDKKKEAEKAMTTVGPFGGEIQQDEGPVDVQMRKPPTPYTEQEKNVAVAPYIERSYTRSPTASVAPEYEAQRRRRLARFLSGELEASGAYTADDIDNAAKGYKSIVNKNDRQGAAKAYRRYITGVEKDKMKGDPGYDKDGLKEDLQEMRGYEGIIKKYDKLRKTLGPDQALEQLSPEEQRIVIPYIREGVITAGIGGGMPKTAGALTRAIHKRAFGDDPEWDKMKFQDVVKEIAGDEEDFEHEQLYPAGGHLVHDMPYSDKGLMRYFLNRTREAKRRDDKKTGQSTIDFRERITPTALGYTSAGVAGGGLGSGIGALVAGRGNRTVGALTGGAIGAVAAPLALLLASKQGWIQPSQTRKATSEAFTPKSSTDR
jgi:hypothetical protein